LSCFIEKKSHSTLLDMSESFVLPRTEVSLVAVVVGRASPPLRTATSKPLLVHAREGREVFYWSHQNQSDVKGNPRSWLVARARDKAGRFLSLSCPAFFQRRSMGAKKSLEEVKVQPRRSIFEAAV